MLLPIAKDQPSYFKDSFVLKALLDKLVLPPNARLFTADAVSMYTNIKTSTALQEIGTFITKHQAKYPHLDAEAVIAALHLVFKNNIFALGDTYWMQTSGTEMGTPPALARAIAARHLVFKNNIFALEGDTYWRQTSGTAMGTPPALAWATIFYALHERKMVPRWTSNLLFYKRFLQRYGLMAWHGLLTRID
eukprot:scaffold76745_cov49-Cyclotella_meneghiniana.AAC.3